MPKCQPHHYTDEQKQFLSDNRTMTRKDLTAEFNRIFGANQSQPAITAYCKARNWLTGRYGRFEKGKKPWNAGTKGICKANKGSFKKGHQPNNLVDIGHERIDDEGYVWIKVDGIDRNSGNNGQHRFKHHVVWEAEHGKIPAGHVLRFIDGNRQNCNIDNLVCIPKSVNVQLNRMKFGEMPVEVRGTVIAIARLEAQLRNKQKQFEE